MALAGSNTASLIGILEGAFGCIESNTASTISADHIPATSQTSTQEKPLESIPMTSSGDSSLVTIELVFPLKSPSPVVAGIPEALLPLCGPETCSHYRCQYPSCNEEFCQKQQPATMCTMTIYMWLWLGSIAVPTIPPKCSGTVHLHGSTTLISMCKIISQFFLMTLLFLSSLAKLVLSPLFSS